MGSAQYVKELVQTTVALNDTSPFLAGNPVKALAPSAVTVYGANHPSEARSDQRAVNAGQPATFRTNGSVSLKYAVTYLDGTQTTVRDLVPLLQSFVHDDAGTLTEANRLRAIVLINGTPITRVAQDPAGPSAGEFDVRPTTLQAVIAYTGNATAGDTVTLTDGASTALALVADTDFTVGADADATATNLVAAINADATAGFSAVLDSTANTITVTHDLGYGTPTVAFSTGFTEYTSAAGFVSLSTATIGLGTTYGAGTKCEVIILESTDIVSEAVAEEREEQITCYTFMHTSTAQCAISRL